MFKVCYKMFDRIATLKPRHNVSAFGHILMPTADHAGVPFDPHVRAQNVVCEIVDEARQ